MGVGGCLMLAAVPATSREIFTRSTDEIVASVYSLSYAAPRLFADQRGGGGAPSARHAGRVPTIGVNSSTVCCIVVRCFWTRSRLPA